VLRLVFSLLLTIWVVNCFSTDATTKWQRQKRVPTGRDRLDSWDRRRSVSCCIVGRILSGTSGMFRCHRRRYLACKWRALTGNRASRMPCPMCKPESLTGTCPTNGIPWPVSKSQNNKSSFYLFTFQFLILSGNEIVTLQSHPRW
jgi:hypothetical protein